MGAKGFGRQVLPAVALAAGLMVVMPAANLRAQTTQRVEFNLPAQDLNRALLSLADRAGIQIVYDSAKVQGLRSTAVSGSLTPTEALTRMLEGTGYTYSQSAPGRLSLVEAPRGGGATVLPTISVEGRQGIEPAWAPVNGYVATRSATATKTNTPLIETPQAISVVTRDQIDTQRPRNVAEALRYTSGIRTEATGAQAAHDGVIIRGFTQFAGNLYQDGLRRSTTEFYGYDITEPYALERVEVLRGPASVLYGQNSPGGIVNSVTKRPTAAPFSEVEIQGGNFDRRQIAGDTSGSFGNSKVSYRLTALGRDSDTQVDYTKDDRRFVAGALAFNPSDATSITLFADYIQQDGAFNTGVPAAGSVLPNANGRIPSSLFVGEPNFDRMDNEAISLGYQLEHALSDAWTLRQNARYRDMEVDRRFIRVTGIQANQRTINRSTSVTFGDAQIATIDNQAEVKFKTASIDHTMLMGMDYYGTTVDHRLGGAAVSTLDIFAPAYGSAIAMPAITTSTDMHADQLGLYLQDQIKFDRNWVFTFGGRQDWARSKTDNRLNGTQTDRSDNAFTGRAGLVYLFDNGLAPYVSYSESFLPAAGNGANGRPFEPETGRQHEVGVKYQPAGYNSFITASAFDLRRQNVTTRDPANPSFNIQTGEVTSKGFELEGKASLSDGWNLIAAYTYTDAEVTKSNNTDLGKTPTAVPEHMAALWTDYTFRHGPMAGLRLGGGARFIGDTYGDSTNTFQVPAFTVFDAEVSYDLGQLSNSLAGARFAINGVNLADKEYVSNCASLTGCQFGVRRVVLATLRYAW